MQGSGIQKDFIDNAVTKVNMQWHMYTHTHTYIYIYRDKFKREAKTFCEKIRNLSIIYDQTHIDLTIHRHLIIYD